MATLVLQTAGQALGGMIGGPFGAMLGRAAGAIGGALVDQALFGPPTRRIEGPRLADLHVMGSSEGAPIPRLWGRARLAGQVIWATSFEEEVATRSQGGGKGGLGRPAATYTDYAYYANFAVGLCQGVVGRIGRVWADGKEIALADVTWRLHPGTETQQPDSLIVAKEGEGQAPAYRGTAYVVFERLPLARFGNRLPQLSFEVFRGLDDVEARIGTVNIIPGSTEFGYDTAIVRRDAGWGVSEPENTHSFSGLADWTHSLDQLEAACPNLAHASLVVAWFGDDLRCGTCRIRPAVESRDKRTEPRQWRVAGETRATARVVSTVDGRPAFGGTPDDASVLAAIADLKARGLSVTVYPFVLVDVAAGNVLADPWTGEVGQPVYPWRGRITCDPAPGRPASADRTAAARAQVAAFFGAAEPGHFSRASGTVAYAGPDDWGLRRMVLHYANLCALAGGVDSFLIGSELKALTPLRDGEGRFAAVEELVRLAADVKAILPAAAVSYAADWSEYFGYQPQDGSGDVWFHLDALWASPSVAFVGIDNYMPLTDWRDGTAHEDAAAGARSIYDLAYLRANVAGGEGFDWYYADAADREAQVRTPIADGAYGKPWVFRYKDLKAWWSSPHHHRPGGVEQAEATAWVPGSKPIRFTELGCPAVDKGTNQPNVFFDPRSSESALPWFSTGVRDDLIQRRAIAAQLDHWSSGPDANPLSPVYGGPMVEVGRSALWAWDARPFPAFPFLLDVWADGANFDRGHWLNGRMSAVELGPLVADLLAGYGFADCDVSGLEGVLEGYVVDRPMSAREALEPLGLVFGFDAVESGDRLRFLHRAAPPPLSLTDADLVEVGPEAPLVEIVRAQESELPATVRLDYAESGAAYRRATAAASRLGSHSRREAAYELAGSLPQSAALALARALLRQAWAGRETARFALPPSRLAVEPGDAVELGAAYRIEEVTDAGARAVRARACDPAVFDALPAPAREATVPQPPAYGEPAFVLLDLPLVRAGDSPHAPFAAAASRPWPGRIAVLRDQGGGSFGLEAMLATPAVIGELAAPLAAGPLHRIDRANSLDVRLVAGALESRPLGDVLAGANLAAVGSADDGWEIVQFLAAEPVGERRWRLARLLRGQAGSEPEMRPVRPAGSRFVLLDAGAVQLPADPANLGRLYDLRVGPAHLDAADPASVSARLDFRGLGLRPLAPVHPAAVRTPQGFALRWVRRTRVGGDAWEPVEVPLGEDAEAYEVDVLADGAVMRTLAAATPEALYPEAAFVTDFALPLPARVQFRIHQISAVHGRGAPCEVHADV